MKKPKRTAIKKSLEKDIENSILKFLNLNGIFAWKINTTGIWDAKRKCFRKISNPFIVKGHSDILAILHGHLLAIEVKRPGEKPRPDQLAFLNKIADEGGFSTVATSIRDVEEFLERVVNELVRRIEEQEFRTTYAGMVRIPQETH